jgi:hypothetical protein
MISPSERFYHPGGRRDDKIASRKQRFAALVAYARERNGWLTSVPGAPVVTMECLPDSKLPDDLRELGYVVEQVGVGERILASAVERFGRRSDGELVLLTAGSTEVAVEARQHAGITRVLRFEFDIP